MKRFITAFAVSAALLVAANILSYFVRSDPADMNDGFRRFGFPLLVLEEGGFAGGHDFSRAALWINVAITVSASTLIAALFATGLR